VEEHSWNSRPPSSILGQKESLHREECHKKQGSARHKDVVAVRIAYEKNTLSAKVVPDLSNEPMA